MKLQEAIDHLNESLNDPNREWCEECRQEHEQLLSFLIELKGLRLMRDDRVIESLSQVDEKAVYWQDKYDNAIQKQLKMEQELERCSSQIDMLRETIQGKEQQKAFLRGELYAYEKIFFGFDCVQPWTKTDEESGDE